jgi:hypothetical protein
VEGCAVRLPSKLLALTLSIATGFAASGLAQTAPADGQSPPTPDKGTTLQLNCIDSSGETKGRGRALAYVTTFENKCEARMKCAVFVHAVHPKGSTLGRATLVLAPASQGAAAKKSYAMKVPASGGMTTSTRECRVY